MHQHYQVFAPAELSPQLVVHTKFGRRHTSLQAARRLAKQVRGQIRPAGSNQVLEDHA